jgi:hypothetical protein
MHRLRFAAALSACLALGAPAAAAPPAPACGSPRGDLDSFESTALFFFNGGSDGRIETDKRLAILQSTVRTLFECYPEKAARPMDLKADPAKTSDSRAAFERWMAQARDAWTKDPETFLKKVSPAARPGIEPSFMAARRLLFAYEKITIAVSRRASVRDVCAAALETAGALGLADDAARRYAADYRALYFPLFPEANTGAARYARVDASCAPQAFLNPSGLDPDSPVDAVFADAAAKSLPPRFAVQLDVLRRASRPDQGTMEAPVVLFDGRRAKSTITPNTRLPDGRWVESDQRHWTRDELLGSARYWTGQARGKSEDGAEGFARFGDEAMAVFYALGAHVLDDPKPDDRRFLEYLDGLSRLKGDAWRALPAKSYFATVDAMTQVFVRYADAWDDVRRNPTTTQILRFGASTEMLAVDLYAGGKMATAAAKLGNAAVKDIVAARLRSTPGATMAQIEADLDAAVAAKRPPAPANAASSLAVELERARVPNGKPLVFDDAQLKLMNAEAVESVTLDESKNGARAGAAEYIRNFEAASRQVNEFVRGGEDLSLARIEELHRTLLKGTPTAYNAAVYADAASKHAAEFCVKRYLANEAKLPPSRLAAEFFKDFLGAHPFCDGNGRTSQLLMRWILQRNGLPPPKGALPSVFSTDLPTLTRAVEKGILGSKQALSR